MSAPDNPAPRIVTGRCTFRFTQGAQIQLGAQRVDAAPDIVEAVIKRHGCRADDVGLAPVGQDATATQAVEYARVRDRASIRAAAATMPRRAAPVRQA